MPTTPNTPRRLRIGGVPYLVGAPLLEGLDQEPSVELVREPPRQMIAPLRQSRLDAALLSSIEAFRRPGYTALGDIGIACDGPVRSVRLFLRKAPRDVVTVAFDRSSETSVALTRILLERRFGARLGRTFDIEPTRQPFAIDADAVLLIGDAGLFARHGDRQVLDLGQEWRAWQGLPFVFALWLIRPEPAVAAAGPLPDNHHSIRVARELWAAHHRGCERGVEDGTGGAIRYELTAEHREGLRVFREEASGLGLCEPGIEPSWLFESSV
jgi:chorismate dehydratase